MNQNFQEQQTNKGEKMEINGMDLLKRAKGIKLLEQLPRRLKNYLAGVSSDYNVNEQVSIVSSLVISSAIISGRLGVRVTPKGSWIENGPIWGAIVGEPGVKKTPVMNKVKGIFECFENTLIDDNGEKKLNRIFVNKSTIRGILSVAENNPHGVVVIQDELKSIFNEIKKDKEKRDLYLQGWSGKKNYKIDNLREKYNIPYLGIALLGNIQPAIFEKILEDELKQGSDGFLERFKLVALVDEKEPKIVNEEEAKRFEHNMYTFIDRLIYLNLDLIPKENRYENIQYVKFSDEAFQSFETIYKQFHDIPNHNGYEQYKSYISKFVGLIPKISLLLHIAKSSLRHDISEETVQNATNIAIFFLNNIFTIHNKNGERKREKDCNEIVDFIYGEWESRDFQPIELRIIINNIAKSRGYKTYKDLIYLIDDYVEFNHKDVGNRHKGAIKIMGIKKQFTFTDIFEEQINDVDNNYASNMEDSDIDNIHQMERVKEFAHVGE